MSHSASFFLLNIAAYFDPTSETKFNLANVTRYITACDHFIDVLLTAIHLSSGQPARATELETLTLTNGLRVRSLFISRGKNQTKQHKNKEVFCFVC